MTIGRAWVSARSRSKMFHSLKIPTLAQSSEENSVKPGVRVAFSCVPTWQSLHVEQWQVFLSLMWTLERNRLRAAISASKLSSGMFSEKT